MARSSPHSFSAARRLLLVGLGASLQVRSAAQQAGCPGREAAQTKVLVHYMIWFGEPGTRHWIWGNRSYFDRMTMGCNNTQHLATRFPPVGGAFASYDAAHAARDVALMKSHCIDGVIIDYQQPMSRVGRSIIDRSLPVVVDAVVRAGLEFAIMFDTSSMRHWGRDRIEESEVSKDWRRIISLASDKRASYLKDAAGNLMFFLFGATPPPAMDMPCPGCAFYAQDANHHGDLAEVPGKAGAFAWVEPPRGPPLEYLGSFYRRKCGTMFPDSPTPCVGAAFPGMQAVYPQHSSLRRSPALLRQGLELCARHGVTCQVPTWNDYNEGTHIEPSYWCDGHAPDEYLQVIRDFKQGRSLGGGRSRMLTSAVDRRRPLGRLVLLVFASVVVLG